MEFHAKSGGFIISHKELNYVSELCQKAILKIKECSVRAPSKEEAFDTNLSQQAQHIVSSITKSLQSIISHSDFEKIATLCQLAIQRVRQGANLPLKGYEPEEHLSPVDHAQECIFDIAKQLRINLDAEWGVHADVSVLNT